MPEPPDVAPLAPALADHAYSIDSNNLDILGIRR